MKEYNIINELTNRLKQISVSNGYNTNAGYSVWQGHYYYDSLEELPLIVILPGEKGAKMLSRQGQNEYLFELQLEVEGHIEVNRGDLSRVYQLRQDITRAIMSGDRTLNQQARQIHIVALNILAGEQKQIEAARVSLLVQYTQRIGQDTRV